MKLPKQITKRLALNTLIFHPKQRSFGPFLSKEVSRTHVGFNFYWFQLNIEVY